jgi:hypothetical protein
MDNNDDYVPSNKEDLETGIFRRKVGHLNNDDDERIKKDLIKESNNYLIFLYIFIVVILFTLFIKTILYEDSYDNLQRPNYLQYKLLNNISNDVGLHLRQNNNKI